MQYFANMTWEISDGVAKEPGIGRLRMPARTMTAGTEPSSALRLQQASQRQTSRRCSSTTRCAGTSLTVLVTSTDMRASSEPQLGQRLSSAGTACSTTTVSSASRFSFLLPPRLRGLERASSAAGSGTDSSASASTSLNSDSCPSERSLFGA